MVPSSFHNHMKTDSSTEKSAASSSTKSLKRSHPEGKRKTWGSSSFVTSREQKSPFWKKSSEDASSSTHSFDPQCNFLEGGVTVMGKGLSKKEKKTIRKELASDKKKLMKEIRGEEKAREGEKRAKKKEAVRIRWCFEMHLRGYVKRSTVLEGEALSQYHREFREQFGGSEAVYDHCGGSVSVRDHCGGNGAVHNQYGGSGVHDQCGGNISIRNPLEGNHTPTDRLEGDRTLPTSPFCIILSNGHTTYDVVAAGHCEE